MLTKVLAAAVLAMAAAIVLAESMQRRDTADLARAEAAADSAREKARGDSILRAQADAMQRQMQANAAMMRANADAAERSHARGFREEQARTRCRPFPEYGEHGNVVRYRANPDCTQPAVDR
jgi:hypothetical protein